MSINIIFHHLKNFFLKTHLSHTIKIFKFLLLRPIKYGLSADIIQDISNTNINYYSTHNVPVYSSRNIETVTQQTFQSRFHVVLGLIWRRDVAQRQINIETTLCISTLKFTTYNNVETMLCFSTLNWTTLDNVETMLSFSKSIFTALGKVETTLWIWPFEKKISLDSKTNQYF